MSYVELANSYKVWIENNCEFVFPDDFTAHAKFVDDSYGPEFELVNCENITISNVTTDEIGTKTVDATITIEGNTYPVTIEVEVYEVIEMEIKEVAIVEWFSFMVFVEYPNSSSNVANGTDAKTYPDATRYTYTRADGTEITCGTYNLGSGNVCILPSFAQGLTLDTFTADGNYMVGDTITLLKGFSGYYWTGELASTETDNGAIKAHSGQFVPECRLSKDVQFKFDGSVWVLFVPYTDVTVDNETVEVTIGKTVSTGAKRVLLDATEGEFTYEVADSSIATVNE